VTILGYGLWYWALGHDGISRIGLVQFLQPVSGTLLAWALLDERLTGSMLLATILIPLGVGIASTAREAFRPAGDDDYPVQRAVKQPNLTRE